MAKRNGRAAVGSSKPRGHWWLRIRRRLEILVGSPALAVAFMLVAGLIVICGVVYYFAERGGGNPDVTHMRDAFGWVFLTLLHDNPSSPTTKLGNATFYIIEILKPISIGLIIATLTTKLVQVLTRKGWGRGKVKLNDHIVICGWSGKGNEIISELRKRGDAESKRPVVILAHMDSNPSKDPLTQFVDGDPTRVEDLRRAAIEQARTAIILADNSYPDIDAEDMDSRTLLTTLAIESIAPKVYTCVEVIRSENLEHFDHTHADEIVISAKLTGALLAHSAATPGLSQVVGELLTFPSGNEFYWIPVPTNLVGRRFGDVLVDLKCRLNCLPVALHSGNDGVQTNPATETELKTGDRLLVIAETFPNLT
jgi:Trk K+ transport system NAD-binding subunit